MTSSARSAERNTPEQSQPEPFVPALRCVLTHWYELRLRGAPLTAENNSRLSSIHSMHRACAEQGLSAVRATLLACVRGERAFEAALLPIGAALFPNSLPLSTVLRHLREGAVELRSAAIFASSYYASTDLSVEIAEQVVSGNGDKLMLQAMQEVLDLRSRTSSGGRCSRCGELAVHQQKPQDWLPRRTT
jgi:hypothetical protein